MSRQTVYTKYPSYKTWNISCSQGQALLKIYTTKVAATTDINLAAFPYLLKNPDQYGLMKRHWISVHHISTSIIMLSKLFKKSLTGSPDTRIVIFE